VNINEYSPLVLAFIGDAHYNFIVKEHLINSEVKMDALHKHTAKYVSAKAQASFMDYLLKNEILNEEEITWFKRGRNAKAHKAPKNTDIITYKVSTGFETLWGYWYMSKNEERMKQIWNIIETIEGE